MHDSRVPVLAPHSARSVLRPRAGDNPSGRYRYMTGADMPPTPEDDDVVWWPTPDGDVVALPPGYRYIGVDPRTGLDIGLKLELWDHSDTGGEPDGGQPSVP